MGFCLSEIRGSVDAARERRDMPCAADFAKTKSHGNSFYLDRILLPAEYIH
jgi:hypothetical protein